MSQEVLTIDLGEIVRGKVQRKPFEEALNKLDWNQYKDRRVRIKGCGPVWAYLLVNNRLRDVASGIDYEDSQGKLESVYGIS